MQSSQRTDRAGRGPTGSPASLASIDSTVAGLKICVVGAGMGGLTTALALAAAGFLDIEVFESASDLGFVGAGIQMAPNMAKILDRLGIWEEIAQEAVVLNETSIREGATDNELGHVDLSYIKENYGYEHMYPAVKFKFGTIVDDIDVVSDRPSFRAVPRKDPKAEPRTIHCDVLLGADGIKSNVRTSMLSHLKADAQIVDTGQAAYRIMLSREQMSSDPELFKLIDSDKVIRWIGEKRHIIAYPVSNKQIYNISSAQPDANFAQATNAAYTTKGSKKQMLQVYGDYCPMIQRMLDLVPEGEVCEWKLRVHAPLPTWVNNTTALIGDACHPTLPHLAQGAAQAIEDAAVLGIVLAKIPDNSPSSINKALKIYEMVRKERAETLVAMAAASGKALHLGSGADKEERDKQFATLRAAGGKGRVPDRWADAEVQKMIYGFDCVQVANEVFEKEFKRL